MRSLDHVGKVIRSLRTVCGLRQEDLSEMTGVHPVVICRIETGAAACAPITLYKLAEGLGLRPSTLVFMAEEYAKTRGRAVLDVRRMTLRFETIEGCGSWKGFLRRMNVHRQLSGAARRVGERVQHASKGRTKSR